MAENKPSGFGLGLVIGAVGGALAGLFLAPKSGKALRKDAKKKYNELVKLLKDKEVDKKVKQIYGKVTVEGKKLYLEVKEELAVALANLKESIEDIDRDTYVEKVDEVVKNLQKTSKGSVDTAKKLKDELVKDWEKLEKKAKKPN